jgi:hypothetical protein
VITADQLATVQVRRVIFHDIPKKVRGSEAQPTLSEIETAVAPAQANHLRRRLVRALGSKSAFDVELKPDSASPVPALIRGYAASRRQPSQFVEMSQQLAHALFEHQTGAMSAGLLSVMDCAVDGRPAVMILKLEREEGAQLEQSERDGRRTYEMSVLENLVLTDGTRLFKSAVFLRAGSDPDDFEGRACDDQRSFGSTDELAQFWMRFLGCVLREEPRVSTKRFYEIALRYVNDVVDDPVEKNTIYEHVVSELKSQKKHFSPKGFIEDYLPPEHQQTFTSFLDEHHVPLRQFALDVSAIERRLRRRSFHTVKGVTVSVPVDDPTIVEVEAERIVVNDAVTRVGA